MIELTKINHVSGTQQRTEINQDIVAEYAESYKAGVKMPPVVLFFDGATHFLADGFHRFFGAQKAGQKTIHEEVIPGSLRDAILYSLKANTTHGLRRTNADKHKAVMTILEDSEWAKWSSYEIAKRCAVSHTFVDNIRSSLATVASEKPATRTVKTKHGTETVMNTASIGKKKEPKEIVAPAPVVAPNPVNEDDYDMLSELKETVVSLADENTALKDRLAVAVIDGTQEEKTAALDTIESLRAEVKRLEIEVRALTDSRNSYQRENAELKRQCAMQRRQLEKLSRAAA